MIVLKILLWILLAVLGIIVIVLILPIRGEVSFIGEKLRYKAKLWFIPVLTSEGGGVLGWLKKRRGRKKPKADDLSDSGQDDLPDLDEDFDDLPLTPSEQGEEAEEAAPQAAAEEAPQEEADQTASQEEAAAEELPTEEPEEEISSHKKKRRKKEKPPKEPKTLGEKLEGLLDLWRAADRPVLKILKGVKLYELYIDFIIANEDAYKCALNYGRISGALFNLLGWLSVLFTVKVKTVDVNAGFALDKSRWDASVKVSFRLGTLVIAGIWFLITYIFRYFIPGKLQAKKLQKIRRKAEMR